MAHIIQIVLIILLAAFSLIYLCVAGTALAFSWEDMKKVVGNKWYMNHTVLLFSLLVCCSLLFFTVITVFNDTKHNPPQYKQITEPIYKKIN